MLRLRTFARMGVSCDFKKNNYRMKRYKAIFAGLVTTLTLLAQTEFDALRYLQPDLTGTARYSAMAGAFGALGADASAIKDNPAGLGIFRSSELSASMNVLTQSALTDWNRNQVSDGLFKAGFNQLSYVISSVPTSRLSRSTNLQRSNWAFSYHRVKDFNRQLRASGGSKVSASATDYMAYFTADIPGAELQETSTYDPYNTVSLPWISVAAMNAGLINEFTYDDTGETAYWSSLLEESETVSPSYFLRETGHMDEYSLSWSGNFNNRLFLGVSATLTDMKYSLKTDYQETFSVVGSMSMNNYLSSTSTGFGVRIGAIYIPVDNIRLGASLRTPVIYKTDDINYMDLHYNHGGSNYGTIYTPEGTNNYKLQSPLVYNLSAAFIQGKKGLVSLEYSNSSNYGTKMMDSDNNSYNFRYVNDSIGVLFNSQHTIKAGGEYKITDKVALRAGYAYSTSAVKDRIQKEMNSNTNRTDIEYFVPASTSYITGGIGYRETEWAFDLAVVSKMYDEQFFAYNTNKVNASFRMPAATVSNSNLSFIATVSFRF